MTPMSRATRSSKRSEQDPNDKKTGNNHGLCINNTCALDFVIVSMWLHWDLWEWMLLVDRRLHQVCFFESLITIYAVLITIMGFEFRRDECDVKGVGSVWMLSYGRHI